MDKPINALLAQRQRLEQKAVVLLERVETLIADLTAAVGQHAISAVSDIANLDHWGEDDWVYGRLHFADGRLSVDFRYSGDDQADDYHGVEMDCRPWQRVDLTTCDPVWREKMMEDAILASLFKQIAEQFGARETRIDGSLAAVKKVIEDESTVIDAEMTSSLAAVGDENLGRLWQDAVEATHHDTADALTRCSRFLEAVCVKVLRERGVELPDDKSMGPLVKGCQKSLDWPDSRELKGDVEQMLGGIRSICGGIGALRTHFGTAHGASSHLPPLDRGYAVFVKQATVAAATFLLDRHQASPPATRGDDASTTPNAPRPAPTS
ncbi:abortive infection family protein [Burkholderia sp. JKS000303]|uniref:abortive infection family protein n=1 Tax=Burkholderia sp. JKS000303 TaxID=1938747 RepID=UPI000BF363A2|nr:abortive infection family protein [Burkholderia sp. JKS000303]PFH12721.1 abortive infection Abi-like protein [Burkholderia sp. JKS000303]